LTSDGITLDPATHRCSRQGADVPPTPREFSLLEYLMRREGQVATKREILDHVWGNDFEGDPNIVEVYVKHLRDKLDRPFGADSIHTVRGVGYLISSGSKG
ncbi:MAG: winged helix-turn-helix domain-containing protein, partial [Actinomycetota bacterium]